MAIGTVTIGETPCCGVIERTYETWQDNGRTTHNPGGEFAPVFANVLQMIDRGICPDCGRDIRGGPLPQNK